MKDENSWAVSLDYGCTGAIAPTLSVFPPQGGRGELERTTCIHAFNMSSYICMYTDSDQLQQAGACRCRPVIDIDIDIDIDSASYIYRSSKA